MKIIDLLNKIANGEEVPKKVIDKTRGILIESTEEYDLYDKLYEEDIYINDEVEIIEEEKKIPEKIRVKDYGKCIHDVTHKEKEFSLDIRELQIRYNQLLDYLKSKGE